MSDAAATILLFGGVAFPFVAMAWLWRRMKRVRDGGDRPEPARRSDPWQERVEKRDGVGLTRDAAVNEELLALGEQARHARWPLDNR